MPELPDVENFRAMARDHFINASVTRIVVSDPEILETTTVAAMRRRLRRRHLHDTGRHGKYLFLDFGEERVVAMHFGPAGALCRVPAGHEEPAFVRFRLDFSNGESLAYVNRRRIGRVRLVASAASFIEQAGLGPDALDPAFGFPEFAECLAGRKQPIKNLLVDQSKLSGIGNTYSDEILFHARIHPAVPAGELNMDRGRRLFRAMRTVLCTAIDLDPSAVDFRARLPADFLLPHRHPGGHCPRCGTELDRGALSGHTSTWCPRCQQQAVTLRRAARTE